MREHIAVLRYSDGTIACILKVKNYETKSPAEFNAALNSAFNVWNGSDQDLDTVLRDVLGNAGYQYETVNADEILVPGT